MKSVQYLSRVLSSPLITTLENEDALADSIEGADTNTPTGSLAGPGKNVDESGYRSDESYSGGINIDNDIAASLDAAAARARSPTTPRPAQSHATQSKPVGYNLRRQFTPTKKCPEVIRQARTIAEPVQKASRDPSPGWSFAGHPPPHPPYGQMPMGPPSQIGLASGPYMHPSHWAPHPYPMPFAHGASDGFTPNPPIFQAHPPRAESEPPNSESTRPTEPPTFPIPAVDRSRASAPPAPNAPTSNASVKPASSAPTKPAPNAPAKPASDAPVKPQHPKKSVSFAPTEATPLPTQDDTKDVPELTDELIGALRQASDSDEEDDQKNKGGRLTAEEAAELHRELKMLDAHLARLATKFRTSVPVIKKRWDLHTGTKNDWNAYGKYFAANLQEEMDRIPGKPAYSKSRHSQLCAQAYGHFKEENPNFPRYLETWSRYHGLDRQMSQQQRKREFSKVTTRLIQQFEQVSTTHGFQVLFAMAGDLISLDQSLRTSYISEGAEGFIQRSLWKDKQRFEEGFQSYVYKGVQDEVMLQEARDLLQKSQPLPTNANTPPTKPAANTKTSVQGSKSTVHASAAPATSADEESENPSPAKHKGVDDVELRKKFMTMLRKVGMDFPQGKLPWLDLPARLHESQLCIYNYPQDIPLPGAVVGKSNRKGIGSLPRPARLALLASFDHPEHRLHVETWDSQVDCHPVLVRVPPPHDAEQPNAERIFGNGSHDFKGPKRLVKLGAKSNNLPPPNFSPPQSSSPKASSKSATTTKQKPVYTDDNPRPLYTDESDSDFSEMMEDTDEETVVRTPVKTRGSKAERKSKGKSATTAIDVETFTSAPRKRKLENLVKHEVEDIDFDPFTFMGTNQGGYSPAAARARATEMKMQSQSKGSDTKRYRSAAGSPSPPPITTTKPHSDPPLNNTTRNEPSATLDSIMTPVTDSTQAGPSSASTTVPGWNGYAYNPGMYYGYAQNTGSQYGAPNVQLPYPKNAQYPANAPPGMYPQYAIPPMFGQAPPPVASNAATGQFGNPSHPALGYGYYGYPPASYNVGHDELGGAGNKGQDAKSA